MANMHDKYEHNTMNVHIGPHSVLIKFSSEAVYRDHYGSNGVLLA